MSKETVQYRTYFFAGVLFDDESTSVVPSRDVEVARANAPKGAFAFQFYEKSKVVSDGETLWGPEKNQSPRYYIGGEAFTLSQVKRRFPTERILISNMEGNGYGRVIRTRVGNWQPLDKKAVIVKG